MQMKKEELKMQIIKYMKSEYYCVICDRRYSISRPLAKYHHDYGFDCEKCKKKLSAIKEKRYWKIVFRKKTQVHYDKKAITNYNCGHCFKKMELIGVDLRTGNYMYWCPNKYCTFYHFMYYRNQYRAETVLKEGDNPNLICPVCKKDGLSVYILERYKNPPLYFIYCVDCKFKQRVRNGYVGNGGYDTLLVWFKYPTTRSDPNATNEKPYQRKRAFQMEKDTYTLSKDNIHILDAWGYEYYFKLSTISHVEMFRKSVLCNGESIYPEKLEEKIKVIETKEMRLKRLGIDEENLERYREILKNEKED